MIRWKYPRTLHLLPDSNGWEEGEPLSDLSQINHIVVTEKMDGENITFTRENVLLRSGGWETHPSRWAAINLWSEVCYLIPDNWKVCGEYLYAQRGIWYQNLESYLYVHSVWDAENVCLSWSETQEWADLLGLPTVNVVDEYLIGTSEHVAHIIGQWQGADIEGLVFREAGDIPLRRWGEAVGKYVFASYPGSLISEVDWRAGRFAMNQLRPS